MKVSILNVDSLMVNRALMSISAWHKKNGDSVDWYKPLFDNPDRIYISQIFCFSQRPQYLPNCERFWGGTGLDVGGKLPKEIDEMDPDYSIYPNCDYSIQFFSRGCIRNCPFCVVREKEGYIQPVKPMALNPKGKHIEVFDNNFFANPEWKKSIETIHEWGQPVNLHGVDLKLLDEEQCAALNSIKHHKQIHIAWDSPRDNLEPRLREIVRWIKPYKLMCYVLIGYWSTPEEDLYRVETLRSLGIDPFAMPFNKKDRYQRRFARWVNHKAIFKSVKWSEYLGR